MHNVNIQALIHMLKFHVEWQTIHKNQLRSPAIQTPLLSFEKNQMNLTVRKKTPSNLTVDHIYFVGFRIIV